MSNQPILKQIYNFLINPKSAIDTDLKAKKVNLQDTFIVILKLVSLMIVLAFTLGIVTDFVVNLVGYKQDENSILLESLISMPGWLSILFVVFIGPMAEELSFRLFLSTKKWIFLLGGFFYLNFIFTTLAPYFISESLFGLYTLGWFGFWAVVFSALWFTVKNEIISGFASKYLNYLIYFSAVTFGLIHISNYVNLQNYWWIAPFLVLPQLIVGLILPFIRLKFGFIWSFITHAVYNFTLAIYILGLIAGPGAVSKLVTSPEDAQKIIDGLNSGEKLYVTLISMASILAWVTVLILFVDVIWEYIVWKRNRKVLD